MNPLTELDALSAYVQPVLPTASIHLLNLPEVPQDDMLVFRLLGEVPQIRNGIHIDVWRSWQVLYFNKRISKVVENVHQLGKAFIHGVTIPYKDEQEKMWYIRVRAFSAGQPQQTESGFDYSLSILETVTKGVRSTEQFERMEEAIFRMEVGE